MPRRASFRRIHSILIPVVVQLTLAASGPESALHAEPTLPSPRDESRDLRFNVGARERESVLTALRRSGTFRSEMAAALASEHLTISIEARPIDARAHFEHTRPEQLEGAPGFRVGGTARVHVPAPPSEFASRLGHEISHARSLQMEGCLDDPGCRPLSQEFRARRVEAAIREEWNDPTQWISHDEARSLLDGAHDVPGSRTPVLTARSTPPESPETAIGFAVRRIPARTWFPATAPYMPLR